MSSTQPSQESPGEWSASSVAPCVDNHTNVSFKIWLGVTTCTKETAPFVLNGNNLTVSRVIATAMHSAPVKIPEDENSPVVKKMEASVKYLSARLEEGWTIYGVNTGVGGSADVRTKMTIGLQTALLQHLHSAIIPETDLSITRESGAGSNLLPCSWTKASIVIRANQCIRGHSGIRVETVKRLISLLDAKITPLVPKRGSISASGDLMPLSYLAGVITGNPSIYCQVEADGGEMHILRADMALKEQGLDKVMLHQKEALALVNGTAPSAAAGSINVFNANQQAVLAQLLTTMTAECMAGNVEWVTEFIHEVHPQAGQTECAANMRDFLAGSNLAKGLKSSERTRTRSGLCQDRYSTRTSPQWLGPYLEDLVAASKQVRIELNSTSDNPIINVDDSNKLIHFMDNSNSDILHGGNFQATSITSAMDKTRQAVVMIGRLIFSQCTELINPMLNNNLPANLVSDSPSMSFTMKGIDINMTSYMSELASLANPIPIFPAEMGNQGVNSMALLSARKTAEAIEILNMMIASHIFVLCQAADLRAFQEDVKKRFSLSCEDVALSFGVGPDTAELLREVLQAFVGPKWEALNTVSYVDRLRSLEEAISGKVARFFYRGDIDSPFDFTTRMIHEGSRKIAKKYEELNSQVLSAWLAVENFVGELPTTSYLAESSGHVYRFVREELKIPFHRGVIYDPLNTVEISTCRTKQTIGTWVTRIYESLMNGKLMDRIMTNVIVALPTVDMSLEAQLALPGRVLDSTLREKKGRVMRALDKAMNKLSIIEKNESGSRMSDEQD